MVEGRCGVGGCGVGDSWCGGVAVMESCSVGGLWCRKAEE